MATARTLFDKIWDAHVVRELPDRAALLYIDRLFFHERTGGIALRSLNESGRAVANPAHAFAVADHIVDTREGRTDSTPVPGGDAFIRTLREASREAGIHLFDVTDADQGIGHLVAAEQGIALPGLSFVCPDSHTCTLGALGALAFGIGTSDCEHVLATEMLKVRRPKTMRVTFTGTLPDHVRSKDLVLSLLREFGVGGGAGYAVEFAGPAIDALPMEARFTICNMAVEFAAFTGIIAPDARTIEYLRDRPYAPSGEQWDAAVEAWSHLKSDPDARFDKELELDASNIGVTVTWGTSPQHALGLDSALPSQADFGSSAARKHAAKAMAYMGLAPGSTLRGTPIDGAFIGSCTNSRLSDLRDAAEILRGRRIAPNVKALCVPGSTKVKRAAEAEGLDKVFKEAGFEWRESGCSLCFYAGGDGFAPEQRVVSSTNRNFEGRQGPMVRTHLASPRTVAASAVSGFLSDAEAVLNAPGEQHAAL
ncbi:MAG: 3-isopropylmalate dehydratase large subunit [Gammaproteobacteria bacterium]